MTAAAAAAAAVAAGIITPTRVKRDDTTTTTIINNNIAMKVIAVNDYLWLRVRFLVAVRARGIIYLSRYTGRTNVFYFYPIRNIWPAITFCKK